jgi:hypothetical protein
MKLPVVQGVIRRRLLVNFRVDPEVMARHLPPPFRPKLHHGFAIAGICLIRLERVSWMNRLAGGRLFPGRQHAAEFEVEDDGTGIDLRMRSRDGTTRVEVAGTTAPQLPETSVFASLHEASNFFEHGSLGYSASGNPARFDAITLETQRWSVAPFAVSRVYSSYFDDVTRFPSSSITFDHALVMRDLQHRWRSERALYQQVAVAPGL